MSKPRHALPIGLIAACCLFVSACRQPETPGELAAAWQEAALNNRKNALKFANQLLADTTIPKPDSEAMRIAANSGLSDQFITGTYPAYDLQAWHHAAFFHQLANQIIADRQPHETEIDALFRVVTDRLAEHDPDIALARWPHTIWQIEAGLCDRQSWVMCELAYQLGYETQIVYLGTAGNSPSPHTICELRNTDGRVWTADPLTAQLLPDVAVVDVARDPELAKRLWPDEPTWQKAVTTSVFWTPAYPQDYRPTNQALHQILTEHLGANCPRFGDPPEARLLRYRDLIPEADRAFNMGYWNYPFKLLAWQMQN